MLAPKMRLDDIRASYPVQCPMASQVRSTRHQRIFWNRSCGKKVIDPWKYTS